MGLRTNAVLLSANSETSLAVKTMTHQPEEGAAHLIRMGDIESESQEAIFKMVGSPGSMTRQTACLNSGDQGSCPTSTSVSAPGLRPQTLNLPPPQSQECRHRDQHDDHDQQCYPQSPQHHYHRQQQRQQHQHQISMDQTTTYLFGYVFWLHFIYFLSYFSPTFAPV